MTNWKSRSSSYNEVQKALEEAKQLEEAASQKYDEAASILYSKILPQTREDIEEDSSWLDDVISFAEDGAAIIDAEGNVIGKVIAVNGIIDLK